MLHPSYTDLMKAVNGDVEEGDTPVVNSRYSIVLATSKRARQIIAGDETLVPAYNKKPLSVAIEELNKGEIKIIAEDDLEDEEELEIEFELAEEEQEEEEQKEEVETEELE